MHIHHLPLELIQHNVLDYLTLSETLCVMKACRKWYTLLRVHHWIDEKHISSHSRRRHFMQVKLLTYMSVWNHVTHLKVQMVNTHKRFAWPSSLIYLKLSARHELIESWPSTLIHLKLDSYNQPLNLPWPSRLQTLSTFSFNQPLTQAWPNSLIKLKMVHFNQPLTQAWPSSLQRLTLCSYDYVFTQAWPDSLKYIQLFEFEQTFVRTWPSQLKKLVVYKLITICSVPEHVELVINDLVR